jgi:hypothetical protein
MATIFPSDPVIDDVFEKWQWDGTVWKLIGTFDTGNALHIHNEDTTNVHGIPDTLAAFSLQTYSSSEPADPNIGDIWVESDIDVPTIDSSRFLRWRKTMVGGETSLSGNDDGSLALQYTPNYEQLYINGVLQVRGQDYLATTGNTITDITALSSGDTVEVFSAVALAVADVYTQTQSDAKYGTGMDLVTSQSFTSQTTCSMPNNVFTSKYNQYLIVIDGIASSNAGLFLRLKTNGTEDVTAGNYRQSITQVNFTGTAATSIANGSTTSTSFQLSSTLSVTKYSQVTISNPLQSGLTSMKSIIAQTSENGYSATMSGNSISTLAQDSFNVICGTFTGTVKVYGLRTS